MQKVVEGFRKKDFDVEQPNFFSGVNLEFGEFDEKEWSKVAHNIWSYFLEHADSGELGEQNLMPGLKRSLWELNVKKVKTTGADLYDRLFGTNLSRQLSFKHKVLDSRLALQEFFVKEMASLGDVDTDFVVENEIGEGIEFADKSFASLSTKLIDLVEMHSGHKISKEKMKPITDWLESKFQEIVDFLPHTLLKGGSFGKLVRTMMGVSLYSLFFYGKDIKVDELEKAIKAGYYFGLTYIFLDDLLDTKDGEIISKGEKKLLKSKVISALATGKVEDLEDELGNLGKYLTKIFREFSEIFPIEKHPQLYTMFSTMFNAIVADSEISDTQKLDRDSYILKAAFSRIIAGYLGTDGKLCDNQHFINMSFAWANSWQMIDDFKDYADDLKKGLLTPFTLYKLGIDKSRNPLKDFLMGFAMLQNLLPEDHESRFVISRRIIVSLMGYIKASGDKDLSRLKNDFGSGIHREVFLTLRKIARFADTFIDTDTEMVRRTNVVAEANRSSISEFKHRMEFERINLESKIGELSGDESFKQMEELLEILKYGLDSGGKRIRPGLVSIMAEDLGLENSQVLNLQFAIEVLHTASLMIDDLPNQDNAMLRRGRETAHRIFGEGKTMLTGIGAIFAVNSFLLKKLPFDFKTNSSVVQYLNECGRVLSVGQALDEERKSDKNLNLSDLEEIAYRKTGVALEMSLVAPAIAAGKDEIFVSKLKEFSRIIGIAYQIGDDLLDIETENTGKDKGLDNGSVTFLSILGGVENTKTVLEQYLEMAKKLIQELNLKNQKFYLGFLEYLKTRKS